MALEDFTTYTEVDTANNRIVLVGTDHIDFVSSRNNEETYLYKDYTADHFGDFTHKVDARQVTAADNSWQGYVWGLSNTADELLDDPLHIGLIFYGSGTQITLQELYSTVSYTDSYDSLVLDTTYYFLIKKTGTAFKCGIYSTANLRDAGDATDGDIDNLALTLHADHKFRYIYGCSSITLTTAYYATFDIDNLDLQEGAFQLSITDGIKLGDSPLEDIGGWTIAKAGRSDVSYYSLNEPKAFYFSNIHNRTYITYGIEVAGSNNDSACILYYDHDTKTFSSPVTLATGTDSDYHGSPTVLVSSNGKIHVFWSDHNGSYIYYRRSTNAEDISSWESVQNIASSSYLTACPAIILSDDTMLVSFRGNTSAVHLWQFVKSEDGGLNWSSIVTLANFPYWCYGRWAKDNSSDRIHLYNWDYNSGLPGMTFITYAYSDDAGDTWKRVDESSITLPMTSTNMTAGNYGRCKEGINTTGTVSGIDNDANHYPYILYMLHASEQARCVYWNGSAWVDTLVLGSFAHVGDIKVISTTEVYAYLNTPYDLERYKWNGSSWSYYDTIETGSDPNGPSFAYILEQPWDNLAAVYMYGTFGGTNGDIHLYYNIKEIFELSLIDGLEAGDAAIRSMLVGLSRTDGLKSGDTSGYLGAIIKEIADGLKAGDSRFLYGMLSKLDGLKAGDSPSLLASLLASDGLKLGDTPLYNLLWFLAVADEIKFSDSNLLNFIIPLIVTDGAKLGDSLSILAKLAISDGLELGDSPTRETIANLLRADGVELGDTATLVGALLYLAIVEGLKPGDTRLIGMQTDIQASDGTKIGDSPLAGMLASLLRTDGLKAGDSVSRLVTMLLAATDGVKVGDAQLAEMLADVLRADGVTLGDITVAGLTGIIYLSLIEAIKLGDARAIGGIGQLLRMWLRTQPYFDVTMEVKPYYDVSVETRLEEE